ncbi:NADP-dependent oxidoreductase domain-containing protein [Xylariaceae sp. FL0016]|nr:NADP-dependent oxidoreductase domain-containing protein [Xylariaceae sp. FL0016]
MGASERLLGKVGAKSQAFSIDTKILVLSEDGNGTLESSKIDKSLSTSLERLKLSGKKINVLHCHAPDFTTPLEDQAAASNTAHQRGLFDLLGVCNFPLNQLTKLLGICEQEGYIKLMVYQGLHNLLSRRREQLIPTLRQHGIRFDAHTRHPHSL